MLRWIALWLASLALVAGFTSVLMRAQASPQVPTADARVVSGPDLGFRVEDTRDGQAVGTLVIRINGQWVATTSAVSQKRLTTR